MTVAQMNHCKSLARRTVGAIYSAFCVVARRLRWPFNQRNGSVLDNFYVGLLRSFFLIGLNRVGLENDLSQLLALPNYSLRKIFVPTLVMHGMADTIVPYSHAEFIARQVPEVTEISVPGGGHLFFAKQSDQLTPKVIAFLEAHTDEAGFMCDQRTEA